MRISRLVALAVAYGALAAADATPRFELVQPELFSANGAQPNAWADFDNDGDLDEFVGFRGRPNRFRPAPTCPDCRFFDKRYG